MQPCKDCTKHESRLISKLVIIMLVVMLGNGGLMVWDKLDAAEKKTTDATQEVRITAIEKRNDKVDEKLDKIADKLDDLKSSVDKNHN